MVQITSGIRSVLNKPIVYDALQALLGANRGRHDLVSHHIRPTSGMRLLDIGCGTARILDHLPNSIVYYGFDSSQDYINEAKNRYGKRGIFSCSMVEKSTLSDVSSFDLVLAVGVLHHLDDAAALNLFNLAKSALRDAGRLVTIDPCFDKNQNPIARFLVSRDRGQNIRSGDQYHQLAGSAFDTIEGLVKHRAWIPYTHWVMECKK